MTTAKPPQNTRAVFLAVALAAGLAALVFFLAFPARRHPRPAPPRDPFGPIRTIAALRTDAPRLTGQFARIRGRLIALRDLNPGQPFPWDVLYTVDDGTGTLPIHWFVQVQRPKALQPPVLPGSVVIVTGKVKRNLELDGNTYPLILSELPQFHNQQRLKGLQ